MMRPRHVVATAAILLALAGCDRPRDPSADARAAPAPAGATLGAPAAPSDAARPNRVRDPSQFTDPQTRAAYTAAKRYAHVLEGIYCYCHCRENIGHRALVECFETGHATECDVCQTEALVAARMTAEGRSVAEIQRAIDAYYKG